MWFCLRLRRQNGINNRSLRGCQICRVVKHLYMFVIDTWLEGPCDARWSLTFCTPNCIYADYGKLGKPSLHITLQWGAALGKNEKFIKFQAHAATFRFHLLLGHLTWTSVLAVMYLYGMPMLAFHCKYKFLSNQDWVSRQLPTAFKILELLSNS